MDKVGELFSLSKMNCILLKTSEYIKDENFYYLAGLDRKQNFNAFLFLNRGKRPVVLANSLEYGVLRKNRSFSTLKFDSKKDFENLVKTHAGKTIGINYSKTTLSSMKGMKKVMKGRKFSDVSPYLGKIRETKTDEEIRKISAACRITSEILDSVPDTVKPGMREIDLMHKIEDRVRRAGVEFSFNTIIASGANSSVPHHETGSAKIMRGRVLLIDMGVSYMGYCSDVTRTFCVGWAPENVAESYRFVKNAQEKALSLVKEGAKSKDIFKAANDVIKNKFGSGMIHSIGHGIGLEVHDFPEGLSDKSKYVLKEDMALAVEPAFYGKDFGIRIEDDIIVEKKSHRLLTKSPREIVEI